MTTVEPHRLIIRSDDYDERFTRSIANLLQVVDVEPHRLQTVLNTSLGLLGFRVHEDPAADRPETWQAVQIAAQAAIAIFEENATQVATADNWLKACYLALICRDQTAMKTLASTPLDHEWVNTLQLYIGQGLAKQLPGDDPTIGLFNHVMAGHTEEFDEVLVHALEQHRAYWSGHEDTTGGIALGPLAMTCLAHDRGFRPSVESGYVPKHLVTKKWLAPTKPAQKPTQKPVPKPERFTVDRHQADIAEAGRRGDALTEELTALIDEHPPNLPLIATKALQETGYHLVGDPDGSWSHTWRSTVLAMQAYTGMFAAATEDARFLLRDNDILMPATGMDPDASAWLNAMYLSTVCRERRRIDMLANVPQDTLYDDLGWIRVLRTYWSSGGGDLVDMLIEAMRAAEQDELRYHPIELFYLLTQDDEAQFNRSLANALQAHRDHWTRTEERAKSPAGFLALGPLAIACLAREAGFKIRVRSDYLPGTLLGGGRVGEVTT